MFAAQGPRLAEQGFSPVAVVGDVPAFGVGAWRNPVGWRPRPFWQHRRMGDGSIKGIIVEYPSPLYTVIRGRNGVKRVTPTGNAARTRRAPKFVTPISFAHEEKLRADGCIPAADMPADLIDMVVECYGMNDLPPEVADLCRARMDARSAGVAGAAQRARDSKAPAERPAKTTRKTVKAKREEAR